MAVTSKELRTPRGAYPLAGGAPRTLIPVAYAITLLLAMLAVYALVGAVIGWGQVQFDDLRYGRPRTTHLQAMVGHESATGQPTHLIAMNLNRQVVVLELAGGDPNTIRSLPGPYLFGAGEDLTPVTMTLSDVDGDGQPDLLLDVRREQIVYLNKDGSFRLPTADEQRQLAGG
jgi:hypothetical protein